MKRKLPWILPAFRTVLFIIGGVLFALFTKKSNSDLIKWWPLLCTVFNLITIFVLILVCHFEGIKFKDLFFDKSDILKIKATLYVVIIMLVIGSIGMFGFSFLFYQGLPEFLIRPIPPWLAILNFALLPITVVFSELPLYFGYSLKRLTSNKVKPLIAIIYVVFFYALQHSFIPLLWDFKYIAFRFLSFLPLMIYLGVAYYRRRKIKEMMIGHGIMDLSTSIQLLLISVL